MTATVLARSMNASIPAGDDTVIDVTDRQLARQLGDALRAVHRLEEAKRPSVRMLRATRARVADLRTELASRIADGRWTAWDALGISAIPASKKRANGAGSVFIERARQRVIAQLTVEGRVVRKVVGSEKEGYRWLADAVTRIEEGREPVETRWTLADWLGHLMADVWPREGLAVKTLQNHAAGIERWWKPHLGSRRLQTLQPEDLDRVIGLMIAADLSPNTIRIAVAPLSKALRKAMERGHVTRNVASMATKPKLVARRPSRYLSPEGARAVLAAAPEARFGDAIALTMLLGLRRGEVLGLAWDRVLLDGERPTARIDRMITASEGLRETTKTGAKGVRTLRLPHAAVAVLRRRRDRQRFEQAAAEDGWINQYNLVFTTSLGTPIDPNHFTKAVNTLTEDVTGVAVGPHALRHTAATLLHEAGVSMKVAQAILGHTTSAMTAQVYTHVLDEQHDRAAAALDALLASSQ